MKRLVIETRADDGWRKITSYPYEKDGGRPSALRAARIGIQAWRAYHRFINAPLRIVERDAYDRLVEVLS